MTDAAISGKQMRRLQTLWGLLCKEVASGEWRVASKNREARLLWVGEKIGRKIASFKELTTAEAQTAIDAIQEHLPDLLRKRPSRRMAQAYGTAGRRGNADKEVVLADAGTLQLLANLCTALGWTRERLDAFLRSRKSPVRSGAIRTLAEANNVIWVLKGMIRRQEKAA